MQDVWIIVTENPPPKNTWVYVYYKPDHQALDAEIFSMENAYYDGNEFFIHIRNERNRIHGVVTHYMPQPMPPKM